MKGKIEAEAGKGRSNRVKLMSKKYKKNNKSIVIISMILNKPFQIVKSVKIL